MDMRSKIEISDVFIERRVWDNRRAICFDFRVIRLGEIPQTTQCLEWLTDDLQLVAVAEGNVIGCVALGLLEEEEVIYVRDRLDEHLDSLLGNLRSKATKAPLEAAE